MNSSFLPIKTSDVVELLGAIPHLEGGFFVETHRSGCPPMSTRGQTGWTDPKLVVTHDRIERQADVRRNGLTSIFWIPTLHSPSLTLAVNKSDHVHYYQGGKPFEYTVYHPGEMVVERRTLGPDLGAGHQLQVAVPGGSWKCGRMLTDFDGIPQEYAIIGEGVGPGFDFNDFRVVVAEDLMGLPETAQEALRPYLHENLHKDEDEEEREVDFEGFYDENQRRVERAKARSGDTGSRNAKGTRE